MDGDSQDEGKAAPGHSGVANEHVSVSVDDIQILSEEPDQTRDQAGAAASVEHVSLADGAPEAALAPNCADGAAQRPRTVGDTTWHYPVAPPPVPLARAISAPAASGAARNPPTDPFATGHDGAKLGTGVATGSAGEEGGAANAGAGIGTGGGGGSGGGVGAGAGAGAGVDSVAARRPVVRQSSDPTPIAPQHYDTRGLGAVRAWVWSDGWGAAQVRQFLLPGVREEFDCPLCLCTEDIARGFSVPGCRHRVCRECLAEYIAAEVSEARVMALVCPEDGVGWGASIGPAPLGGSSPCLCMVVRVCARVCVCVCAHASFVPDSSFTPVSFS